MPVLPDGLSPDSLDRPEAQASGDEAPPSAQFVAFHAGGARLGLPIGALVQVVRPLPVTRVPRTPAYLLGLVNFEHDVVPLLDLAARLGLAPSPPDPERARIVLVEQAGQTVGLLVAAVEGVLHLAGAQEPAPEAFGGVPGHFLSGLVALSGAADGERPASGEQLALLDLDAVCALPEPALPEPALPEPALPEPALPEATPAEPRPDDPRPAEPAGE